MLLAPLPDMTETSVPGGKANRKLGWLSEQLTKWVYQVEKLTGSVINS